jgi:NADP-dependent alcohol dehydrogenase
MNIKRESKKAKLLQYGERIWNITEGTESERIDQAISKTVDFFNTLGIQCTLPDYKVPAETIGKISERFKARKSKLGENKDIGYKEVEAILEDRL